MILRGYSLVAITVDIRCLLAYCMRRFWRTSSVFILILSEKNKTIISSISVNISIGLKTQYRMNQPRHFSRTLVAFFVFSRSVITPPPNITSIHEDLCCTDSDLYYVFTLFSTFSDIIFIFSCNCFPAFILLLVTFIRSFLFLWRSGTPDTYPAFFLFVVAYSPDGIFYWFR